jgi:threonine aldolase
MIDFSSDTQTRPTRAMREAVLDAETGDERHDACPTTLELNRRVAELFGMEAAVFLPSGTMCNEIAIAVHTRPGDEVICARESHIIFAESGGPAALSGVMMNPLDADRGLFTPEQVDAAVRPPSSFAPRSRLLVTEQTSNLGGGAIWPVEQLNAVAVTARGHGLATHLDGARVLNASVATGVPVRDYARDHDSAWLAFTKGLGCPVGAVLAGSAEFIRDAWLLKRRWGGAMRQTGVLTAMCLHALDHHVERLADDHAMARKLGAGLAEAPIIRRVLPVETNIVVAELADDAPDADTVRARLREQGVKVGKIGTRKLRLLTHLDATMSDAESAVRAIQGLTAD